MEVMGRMKGRTAGASGVHSVVHLEEQKCRKIEGKCKEARRIVTKANALVEEFREQFGALKQPAPPRTER